MQRLNTIMSKLTFHNMYKVQSFILIALLALLSYQIPSAFAQSSPTAVESTPTPTAYYTYNPTSEATIPPSYHEYSFLYPIKPDFAIIEASYKDTFNVSWEVIAPYHLPTLTITCWLRTSKGRKLFSNSNISNVVMRSTS